MSGKQPEMEATPIANQDAFKPFGDDVTLIIAQRKDGSLQAFFPEAAAGNRPALMLAQSRPQKVIDLQSSGWTCGQVTATTWRCSRTLGGMRMVINMPT
jgi:hypothetical protein